MSYHSKAKFHDSHKMKSNIQEYMITITLCPQYTALQPMKKQLKQTYNAISTAPFASGEGAAEITLNGNIHYHIKTQDPVYVVQAWVDSLKLYKIRVKNDMHLLFGFVKVDQTKTMESYNDYKYLSKSSESTLQAWKRAGVDSEQYQTNWIYSKDQTSVKRIIKKKASKIKLTESFKKIDNNDSEEDIIFHTFLKK